MQLGVDLSISHVENNFIGTGLMPAPGVDADPTADGTVRTTCSAIFVVVVYLQLCGVRRDHSAAHELGVILQSIFTAKNSTT